MCSPLVPETKCISEIRHQALFVWYYDTKAAALGLMHCAVMLIFLS